MTTITIEQPPVLDTVTTTQRLRELVVSAVRKRGKEQGAYITEHVRVDIICSLAGVFTLTLTHFFRSAKNNTTPAVWREVLKCLPKEHQQKWPAPTKKRDADSADVIFCIEYRPPQPRLKGAGEQENL